MPEGPEVRVVVEWLRKHLLGRHFHSIQWDPSSRYRLKEPEGYSDIFSRLPAIISNIFAKGKCIVIEFNQEFYMTCNLADAGNWTFEKEKHCNTWITYSSNNQVQVMYFTDVRHRGRHDFFGSSSDLKSRKFKDIGPDLLAYSIGTYCQEHNPCLIKEDMISIWNEKLNNTRIKNKEIGIYLLDQKRFSGIGNYARAEILYRARISPFRKLCEISKEESLLLLHHSVNVLYESYSQRGLSIINYRDPEGVDGTFKKIIYREEFDPLGNEIRKDPCGAGKNIYWVPSLQK